MPQLLTEERIESFIDLVKLRHEENQFQRIPLEVEKELIDKIRQGRYRDIHISAFQKMDTNLGLMALDQKTSYTYITVAAIALFSRAAIESGVTPDDAFDLSDALLHSLSFTTTAEEIHHIFQLAAIMFAKQVNRTKQNIHSYQVEQTCNYISRNIFHKISLNEIADYVGLSPNYLCHLFATEMGITIHNYIQREKITVACNLLMHTDRPISEIATYTGFQSQSNFSAIFRKWQNTTPSEYRREMYREVF